MAHRAFCSKRLFSALAPPFRSVSLPSLFVWFVVFHKVLPCLSSSFICLSILLFLSHGVQLAFCFAVVCSLRQQPRWGLRWLSASSSGTVSPLPAVHCSLALRS